MIIESMLRISACLLLPMLMAHHQLIANDDAKQTCTGPFYFYPLPHFSVTSLTTIDRGLLPSCMEMCVKDLCCKSFGLRDGACVTSVISFTLDFQNEVGDIHIHSYPYL